VPAAKSSDIVMKIQSRLGSFDLTMIVISLVIGVGIFKTPALVAEKAGTPFVFYLAWVAGSLISICGALTFAEIGARMPEAGGFYRIFSQCYHPSIAFVINWAQLIALAGSAAAISLIGAEYIRPIIMPIDMQTEAASRGIALTVMTVLFVVNYLGIKTSSRVQNVLSLLKISMILLFCFAVFGTSSAPAHPTAVIQPQHNILTSLGLALIPVFYTWNGYQYTVNFGADVKHPQRNIPRAIFFSMGIVLILYIAINIAYCRVLGFDNLKGSELIAAKLGSQFFGDAGFKITSLVIFVSVIGYVNTSLLSNPRVYYAMAEDDILPPIFKKLNKKTQVQEFALTFFFGLVALLLVFMDSFEKLLSDITFIHCLALMFGAATVFVLRSRMKGKGYSGFQVFPSVLVPVAFILFLLFVCTSVFIAEPIVALIGLGTCILGFPLYYGIKKLY